MTKEHKEVSGVLDNAVLLNLGDGHTVMCGLWKSTKLYKWLSIKSCTNYTSLKRLNYKKTYQPKEKKKRKEREVGRNLLVLSKHTCNRLSPQSFMVTVNQSSTGMIAWMI